MAGGWSEAWRRFSDLLALPLLEESEQGIYRAGGEGESPQAPAAPAAPIALDARGVELEREAAGYRLRLREAWSAWRGALGMVVAGGLAVATWLMQAHYPDDTLLKVATGIMLLFVAVAFGSLIGALRGQAELWIGRDRVTFRTRSGAAVTLPTEKVVSVVLKADPMHRGLPPSVTIEAGDEPPIRLATWRGHAVKKELVNVIAAALGDVTRRGADAFRPDFLLPGPRERQRRVIRFLLLTGVLAFFAVMVPLMWLAFHDRQVPPQAEATPDLLHDERRQLPGEEAVRLTLASLHTQRGAVAVRHHPESITLSQQAPVSLRGLPAGQGPLRFPFALTAAKPARLWIDRNRNGDLSDDGKPIESGGGPFAAEVRREVPPVGGSLWLYSNERLWARRQLTFYD